MNACYVARRALALAFFGLALLAWAAALNLAYLALGAGLVTHGKIDQAGLEQAVGAVISLGAVIWSQLHHSANPPPPSA